MNADGSGFELFASGIRNTVGFDWHPQTHELWFTDNGRDYLGDDAPPDELNRAPRAGLSFGFPYCQGATSRIRSSATGGRARISSRRRRSSGRTSRLWDAVLYRRHVPDRVSRTDPHR
jgi:glucose/arabinose dehydrogenase